MLQSLPISLSAVAMGKREALRSIQQVIFSTKFCLEGFHLMRSVVWLLPWESFTQKRIGILYLAKLASTLTLLCSMPQFP
jgi:hypothetical protein